MTNADNDNYFDKDDYAKLESWTSDEFDITSLRTLNIHKSWKPLFTKLFADTRFSKIIETELRNEIESNPKVIIYPKPALLFNAFALTSLTKLKVIFIGQDPYFDYELYNRQPIPQAMGLSFSVPVGIKIPSSLSNIFKNQKAFKHIESIPEHGNLEYWASQGCLMLNTSLTVKDGSASKNCHQHIWKWFTDEIIKYISETCPHVIFVLWGAHALDKLPLINTKSHYIIASSHPSGLSVSKPLRDYPSFQEEDHFGKINTKLTEWGHKPIIWSI